MAQLGCPADTSTLVTCGTGTKLNSDGTQCIPDSLGGDFNVVVDDFSLGEFEMTNVDVPEQMQPGFPDQRTFTITNAGEEDQDVVFIGINLVPVRETIDEVREEIEFLDSPASCDEENSECGYATRCNLELGACELDTISIGGVLIENLAAGETRDITYELKLPASWSDDDGLYGLVFAINEVALARNDEGDVRLEEQQPEQDDLPRLASAAAVHAPATVIVGVPDKPNLRVLFANGSEGAFELENFMAAPAPIMDVSARISAQGKDAVAPVSTRFELVLPGHEISVPGKDLGEAYFEAHELDFEAAPDTTTYAYNPERTFPLYFGEPEIFGDADNPQASFQSEFRHETECRDYDVDTNECLRELSVENDVGADIIGPLTLPTEAGRLLYQTRFLDASLNPDLDENGEITGVVRMIVTSEEPEYEVNGQPLLADNVSEMAIVFMAPEPEPDAADDDQPEGGVPGEPADDAMSEQAINAPCCGPYADQRENITPTKRSGFGSDWLGGEYQLKNQTTRKLAYGATVAKRTEADNYVRAKILKGSFDIIGIYGHVDYGTQRPIADSRVHGRMTFLGSTMFDATFSPQNCSTNNPVYVTYRGVTTSGPVETCMIIEGEGTVQRPPMDRDNQLENTKNTKPKRRSWFRSWSREIRFMAGPVPILIKGEAGFSSGIVAGAYLIRDASAPQVFYGLQFGVGPFAQLTISIFGGVSIGVARAGVEGTATILRLEFKPTLNFGISQQFDNARNCWPENAGKISFDGPINVMALDGKISIVAYVGIRGCAAWICVNWEKKVFDFSIVSIRGLTYTYKLWDLVKLFPSGNGMCNASANTPNPTPQPQVWSSPKSCYRGTRYCNYARGTGNYSRTFDLPNNGAKLEIFGKTERWYDYLRIYDANGRQIRAYHGRMPGRVQDITGTSRITVRLFTDYSVVRPGVTVKVTPH